MSQSATRLENLLASLECVKEARSLAHFGLKAEALDKVEEARRLYAQTSWADKPAARARTESLFDQVRQAIEEKC